MKSPLHILHLEDDLNDAALVKATLKTDGILTETTRVENQDDFVAALEGGGIDLILSDFTLPAFDGVSALEIVRTQWPDIPFIFVSGTLGEERAIDSLKSGAADYVLKEGLVRLVPAVRRAMQQVEDQIGHRKLEAQFIEAQKMEVLGQLAGGIAHDFNNILAVVMGYGDLIAADLDPNSPLLKYTKEIKLATERATGLTGQLLVFSRKQTVQPIALNLNGVVNDLEQMLRRLIDEGIEMSVVPGEHIGCIKADAGYLGQVLMNMVINARDSMPHGGRLSIETSKVALDEAYAQSHPGHAPGDYVMLGISDTGAGMTDEVQKHLFEAFFTTKSLGKGTGLGLATCQTIVQFSGGHIDFCSEVGKGTTFKIYFPSIEQPAVIPEKPAPAAPLPRGTETLLVVEDDQSVRHLARGILEAQGYEVLTASNGEEALRVINQSQEQRISLVITDVIMPLMNGTVMAEWLKETYPELNILFTSGYTGEAISREGILETGVAFLPKPYSRSTLVYKVREMLDN